MINSKKQTNFLNAISAWAIILDINIFFAKHILCIPKID